MSKTSSHGDTSPAPQQVFYDSNMASNAEQARRFAARNSEEVHKAALAAAQAEHLRVRETALRVFEIEQLRESNERLRQKRIQTEERVRLEAERAMEELRIREEENRAKQLPKPPPRVPTPPPAASTVQLQQSKPSSTNASQPPNQPAPAGKTTSPAAASQWSQKQPITSKPNTPSQPTTASPARNQSTQIELTIKAPSSTPPTTQLEVKSLQAAQAAQKPPAGVEQPKEIHEHLHPAVDRYVDIHKTLKQLRKFIKARGDGDPGFKKKAGDMRRTIIRSMGQLTEGKGVNKVPYQTIMNQLNDSLKAVPSPPCDPSMVMEIKPEPTEGAVHNGETMPSLTIYLLNILAKAGVSQFCSEAGANPKTAEPIGVILVSIFSQPNYMWRGKSLIDILIAKMRVVCPVLFGIRGNEKTEEGRARLGWKKDENNKWISEQEHNDRMTGLGAGYASLSLRDFSKSRLVNPWLPTMYWHALAAICSTPAGETSSTQFIVLKAMIDNYVKAFLGFYGNMGVAALRFALNDFARKATDDNVAASSLKVLADKIKRDTGLQVAMA